MKGMTLKSKVHFATGRRSKKTIKAGSAPEPGLTERVPRIAKLMALAIRFDQLIRDGVVKDYAELARLGHVSRARITQIMNLLNLAPEIQEAILFLPEMEIGRDLITERELRVLVAVPRWDRQQQEWRVLTKSLR